MHIPSPSWPRLVAVGEARGLLQALQEEKAKEAETRKLLITEAVLRKEQVPFQLASWRYYCLLLVAPALPSLSFSNLFLMED